MSPTLLEQAAGLQRQGQPFVLVTVVWRRGPSSSRQGSKCLVLPDGTMRGWLGGACAQPRVVSEALTALRDGRPRLLLLGPLDELERGRREGVKTVPVACASEGAMEVYVEPVLPAPQLVAIGRTPAVETLIGMAELLGWRVAMSDDLEAVTVDRQTAVVVGTQGEDDERALEAALRTRAGYVGLIASRPRAQAAIDYLRSGGVAESDLSRVNAPAGIDLGSTTNEEIGVAILAQLVALRAAGGFAGGNRADSAGSADQGPSDAAASKSDPSDTLDPVCGMAVDASEARYQSEHNGRVWYFCSPSCQRQFQAGPERYVVGAVMRRTAP